LGLNCSADLNLTAPLEAWVWKGETPMATRKQKQRAAAAGTSLDQPAKAPKKTAKVKKTSRGK